MTNDEIIYKSAISAGIYTEQEAAAILATGRSLPIHTFVEWKLRGYSVKKGEKARLHLDLWMFTDKPGKAAREKAAAEGKELSDDPHYYKKRSHLFTAEQVQRTEQRASAAPADDPAPVPVGDIDQDQMTLY